MKIFDFRSAKELAELFAGKCKRSGAEHNVFGVDLEGYRFEENKLTFTVSVELNDPYLFAQHKLDSKPDHVKAAEILALSNGDLGDVIGKGFFYGGLAYRIISYDAALPKRKFKAVRLSDGRVVGYTESQIRIFFSKHTP